MFNNFFKFMTFLAEETSTGEGTTTTESSQNIFQKVTSQQFWADVWDWAKDFLFTSGVRLLIAIIVFIIGIKIIKGINKKINNSKGLAKMPINLQAITKNAIKIALWIALVIIIAGIMGVEMSSIVATFVSLGLVVGMALEGSLSNLAGGVMLLIFKPFQVGDFISYGNDSEMGIVSEVGLFYTTIKTTDFRIIQVPNGTLCNKSITDHSTLDKKRVDLSFSVPFETNMEKVNEILVNVCNENARVLKDYQAPFVTLGNIKSDGYEIWVSVWVSNRDVYMTKVEIKEATRKAFEANGIKFPYNQLTVHMGDDDKTK